jgi:hypothetical protein
MRNRSRATAGVVPLLDGQSKRLPPARGHRGRMGRPNVAILASRELHSSAMGGVPTARLGVLPVEYQSLVVLASPNHGGLLALGIGSSARSNAVRLGPTPLDRHHESRWLVLGDRRPSPSRWRWVGERIRGLRHSDQPFLRRTAALGSNRRRSRRTRRASATALRASTKDGARESGYRSASSHTALSPRASPGIRSCRRFPSSMRNPRAG